MPDPKDRPDEPDTNEPIPTPGSDDTGISSGNDTVPGEETGDPPGDLDDGPLVAMNANRPSKGSCRPARAPSLRDRLDAL